MRAGEDDDVASLDRAWLGLLLDAVRDLGAVNDLDATLDGVVRAVCEVGGFRAAAINVATPLHGELVVQAVAGGAEVLLGERAPLQTWLELLASATRWRDLRYYRHDQDQSVSAPLASWEPAAPVAATSSEAEVVLGNDAWHPEDLLLAPMWAPDGALIGVVSVDQPEGGRFPNTEQLTILELLAAQAGRSIAEAARLARSGDQAAMFGAAFESAATGMVIIGSDLDTISVNAAGRVLLHLPPDRDLTGSPFLDLVDRLDVDEVAGALRTALGTNHHRPTLECRQRVGAGEARWVRAQAARIESSVERPRLVLNLEDITESRLALAELHHQANHDMLTGLPNRRLAYELLGGQLEARPDDRIIVVLACDLDGFKAINDQLGHAAGDELLVQLSNRLSGALTERDLLARIGGDEFIVIATIDRSQTEVAERIARRCVERVRPPFDLGTVTGQVTLSVGVATSADEPDLDAEGLIDLADRALYRAKSAGRDRWSTNP
ncbi:hypothetical protein BH10ACT1_BH10ACT1_18220 [soil metagenome]